jgi:3-oxoacid CoA-transferase subunit B
VKGMGGAMDLVAGAQRVIVAMQHIDKSGAHKILKKCDLPLTGKRCVQTIVTDFGVIEIREDGLHLLEIAPDLSVEDVKKSTGAPLKVAPQLKKMAF